MTHLRVAVADGEQMRPSCQGVAPRRVALDLDGRRRGEVEIPCTTTLIAPPETFDIEVDVPPGEHVLRVVDLATGREASRSIRFPVIELDPNGRTGTVAEDMSVWIDAREVKLGPVRAGRGMRL